LKGIVINALAKNTKVPVDRQSAKSLAIRWRWIALLIGTVLLTIGGIVVVLSTQNSSQPLQTGEFKDVKLPVGTLAANNLSVDTAKSLQVNGKLQVSGSIILSPGTQPTNPVIGQFYLDQTSNQLSYYNGKQFVNVGNNTNSVTNITTNETMSIDLPVIPLSVALQSTLSGTQQAGNFNISGTGQVGTLKTSTVDSSGASLFVNPTTTVPSLPAGTTATLGPTTIGSATTGPGWNAVLSVTKVTMGDANGTAKSISVNFVGGSGSSHVQVAIYEDDGDIPSKPGALLATSAIGNLVPNGLTTLTVPSIGLSANNTYWLAVNTDDTTTTRTYNGGNKSSCFISSNFGFMPDPYSINGCFFDNNVYTIYATYVASVGAGGGNKAQFSLSPTGQAAFQNSEDSGTAFQIQNAAGNATVLNIDTINNRVAIGKATANYKLDIAGGDINLSNGKSLRFGGVPVISANGSGTTTSISNFLSGGTVSAQADNFVVQDANATHRNLVIDNNGAVVFSNRINSATAFQIQNSANIPLFTADSSNMNVTIAGTNTAYSNLRLANAHFASTQTTAPTISTPTNCGSSPTAAVTVGSTDTAGSFTITTGTGGTSSTCDITVTFNKAYSTIPKSILVVGKTDAGSALRQIYVPTATTTTFTTKFAASAGGVDDTTYSFNYWVIE
jgi:hypothetical protein